MQSYDPVIDTPQLLTSKQAKKVPGRPELIHLFVHHLAQLVADSDNGTWPQVRVLAIATVNSRVPQYLVDPRVDLAALAPWSWPNKWFVCRTRVIGSRHHWTGCCR